MLQDRCGLFPAGHKTAMRMIICPEMQSIRESLIGLIKATAVVSSKEEVQEETRSELSSMSYTMSQENK